MGDGDFFELITFFGVFESLVERDSGVSGTEDHLFVTSFSGDTLGVEDEFGADAFAFDLVIHSDLAHLDGLLGDGREDEAADELSEFKGGDVEVTGFFGEVFGVKVETERGAENPAAELDRFPVFRGSVADGSDFEHRQSLSVLR